MELTTIDTNNYAAMAKAMGIANETAGEQEASTLARLRIHHSPVMGEAEVKGKNVNIEVVEPVAPIKSGGSRWPHLLRRVG